MTRLVAITTLAAIVVLGTAFGAREDVVAEAPAILAAPTGFGWIELWIDPAGLSLAAWQIEVALQGGDKIVGIEGGDHPAFREPPHYDPKAIQQERAILAAFHTGNANELPSTRVRVATVMVETRGDRLPSGVITLMTAATVGGGRIDVTVKGEAGR